MEQVFTGFISLLDIKGKPGATAKIMASAIPFAGTPACTFAAAQGRPYCAGILPNVSHPGAPEYTMQHEYVFDSTGWGSFLPRFSYHEIHFIVIVGLSEAPPLASIIGHRVGNIASLWPATKTIAADQGGGRARLSDFSCSNSVLNHIYNQSLWTKSNLVTGGVSVDCPHRERLGYIGDAHTTLETALQNFASAPFYTKWTTDITDIQGIHAVFCVTLFCVLCLNSVCCAFIGYPAHTGCGYGVCHLPDGLDHPGGYIAHTAPTIDGGGGPGWSGFVCVMPWQLFLATEDVRPLQAAYPHQLKLLEFWNRAKNATDGLIHDWSTRDNWAFLGDWLAPHGSEPSTTLEAELFNNCYILYCTRIVANVSLALGKEAAAAQLISDAQSLATAIHKKFFVPSSSGYLDTRQTHLTMPLIAGAVPAEHADGVWAALRKEIMETQAAHIDTGLHGTYFMTKLLSDTSFGFGGGDDMLYAMATVETYPGYVDLLKKGFTAWPENWGTRKAGTGSGGVLRQPYLDSANWTSGSDSPAHGTLNGIGQWFIGGLGGIRRRPGAVGFQHFELRPPWGSTPLSHAQASYDSPYGTIHSAWWTTEALLDSLGRPTTNIHVTYNITVPINARATVYIAANSKASVQEMGGALTQDVRFTGMVNSTGTPSVPLALFEVDSGVYSFSSHY